MAMRSPPVSVFDLIDFIRIDNELDEYPRFTHSLVGILSLGIGLSSARAMCALLGWLGTGRAFARRAPKQQEFPISLPRIQPSPGYLPLTHGCFISRLVAERGSFLPPARIAWYG